MSAENPLFTRLEEGVKKLHSLKDGEIKQISRDEIGKHNKKDDCWIILDGNVYDITTYLKYHPGSEDKILQYGGEDATLEFNYWMHSKNAKKIKDKFCIGIVKKDNLNP